MLTRDGTAEPISRDQILRHARGQGNINFPCSADHEQNWQPYPVDPYSAICDDDTYIHTYLANNIVTYIISTYVLKQPPSRVDWTDPRTPQAASTALMIEKPKTLIRSCSRCSSFGCKCEIVAAIRGGIGWLAADSIPNSLYRVPFFHLFWHVLCACVPFFLPFLFLFGSFFMLSFADICCTDFFLAQQTTCTGSTTACITGFD